MAGTQLSREAYAEIRSGILTVREAKKKYHISQARYSRIRGQTETHTNTEEVANVETEEKSHPESMWTQAWKFLTDKHPQVFLSDEEKQILEASGYSFYERYQIPKQFVEAYILVNKGFIEEGKIIDMVYIYISTKSIPTFFRQTSTSSC